MTILTFAMEGSTEAGMLVVIAIARHSAKPRTGPGNLYEEGQAITLLHGVDPS